MEEFYVKLLCRRVEERFGRHPVTTEDFAALSHDILRDTRELLSVTTLKRIFGRVNSQQVHRRTTLSILSRYAGFSDWAEFYDRQRTVINCESDFKPVNAISADNIEPGMMLRIKWLPDRQITVRNLSDRQYEITEACNTKLHAGDIIEIALLAPNEPMFISSIIRGGKSLTGYIAGQIHGISVEVESAAERALGE